MEIQQDLAIRGESVERIYNYYLQKSFLVNRRYQRKLVWSIEEKQAFIDSIQQGFPIPLILVAEVIYRKKSQFEIIDGMQRLNAIVSFIEGEFVLNGRYFDLTTMALSKLELDKKNLVQKKPVLDREICTKIATYTFPLSIYKAENGEKVNEERIDDIFRRINSNGRHLSDQELRQAGVTGLFPQLVRQLAAKIRGDTSHSEKLLLNAMKEISISNKGLPYGINMFNIFWVSKNVITYGNIRESRDEELIAHLLAYMLLGTNPPPTPSAGTLNSFYQIDADTDEIEKYRTNYSAADIENAVKKIGPEKIEEQFLVVYEELKKVLNISSKTFSGLVFKKKCKMIPQHFQIIFLAFYELLVNRRMKIVDYGAVAQKLNGIGDHRITIKSTNLWWDANSRQDNIKSVRAIIEEQFVKLAEGEDPMLNSGITQLENLLMKSKTEQPLYDFKIGFHRLDEHGELDEKSLHKIFLTLTAMANHGPNDTCYVIIGVADTKKDADRFKDIYGSESVKYNDFHITGVQEEATRFYKDLDSYSRKITQYIKAEPILPEEVKNQLLRDMRIINYYDKSVLVLKIKSGTEPYSYDDKYYERHGSNVSEIEAKNYTNLFKRFLTKA